MNDRRTMLSLALAASVLLARPARADGTNLPVMFVSKSENRNEVKYAIRVSDDCAPEGPRPVSAYWQMLEKSPSATEPLSGLERRYYGIATEEVRGDEVRLALRALPSRPITVRVVRGADGRCVATARTVVGGTPARLFNVHVMLGFLRVRAIVITGWRDSGAVVRETLRP